MNTIDILKKQYELVCGSREAVLNYCETMKPEDLNKKIETFNNESIISLMAHNANTYMFWMKRFSEREKFTYFKDEDIADIKDLKSIYEEVNSVVNVFFNKYPDVSTPVEGDLYWLKKIAGFPMYELLTHVMTHEFHHKGQVMTMSRLLGYTPPLTDLLRI